MPAPMPITVSLAKCNVEGFMASVNYDDEMESLTVALGSNAKRTCTSAAKTLREMADRFDALAKEPEPCKVVTHERINARVRKPHV